MIMGRDTIPHVLLHEVDVVARLKNPRKYARQQQRNLRMIHNVKKVFPYAKIAAAKINEIEYKLAQTDSEAKTEANYQARVQGTHAHFQATVDEINRHTGKDSRSPNLPGDEQHVVQSHQRIAKGTVNAYFWQSLALLFGNNLKADYEPNGRDREIEQIVRTLEKEHSSHISRR